MCIEKRSLIKEVTSRWNLERTSTLNKVRKLVPYRWNLERTSTLNGVRRLLRESLKHLENKYSKSLRKPEQQTNMLPTLALPQDLPASRMTKTRKRMPYIV